MKLTDKRTIHLTEYEGKILDLVAKRKGISANTVLRHLVIYHGLVGGDFPLTDEILGLPPAKRRDAEMEILDRLARDECLKPQSFKMWIREIFGKIDPDTMAMGAKSFVRDLLLGVKKKAIE